jgi:RHS repeat-associated protein
MYGPSELSVEQINNSTGTVTYLHHDQAGSTRLLTGSTGKVEGAYTYTPYGAVQEHTGTATTPLGYDGQYTSSDTGLIYMRARTYDPTTDQFLSVDPFVALTGEPYSYAEDDPINKYDPSGRCGLVCVGGIVPGGVALATGVGEVAIGGGAIAEGTLAGISFVSGASASVIDTKECVGGSGISCVGAGAGFIATGGAGLSLGVLSGNAAAGATAIGLSFGGIGFLGDTAGALASTVRQSNSFGSGCG